MVALAADRRTKLKLAGSYIVRVPVLAAAVIFNGSLVNASTPGGFAKPAVDAVNENFVGVAEEAVTGGSGDGDEFVRCTRGAIARLELTGVTQANAFEDVTIADDQTVGLAGNVVCGQLIEIEGGQAWVKTTA